jgi:hypothetical protein
MKNILIIITLIFGVAMFVAGVVFIVMSEYTVKNIQLCWSPECAKEFIDMLWKSLVYLLIGMLNMLLGGLIITEALEAIDSS